LEVANELRQWRIDAEADSPDVLELERQLLFSAAFYQQGLEKYSPKLSVFREQFRCPWCCNDDFGKLETTPKPAVKWKWRVWESLRDHM